MKPLLRALLCLAPILLSGLSLRAATGDLAVTASCPASVPAGGPFTTLVTITNLGPDPVASVVLRCELAPGQSISSQSQTAGLPFALVTGAKSVTNTLAMLPAGTGATFQINILVEDEVMDGTILVDVFKATSFSTDSNPANNAAAQSPSVRGIANLLLIMRDGLEAVVAGYVNVYQVTVINNGPSAARNVVVHQPITTQLSPAGPVVGPGLSATNNSGDELTHTLAQLGVAESATITFSMRVNPALPPTYPTGAFLYNHVSVSSETQNRSVNQTASDLDVIFNYSDVAILITNVPTAAVGSNFVFTITALNYGPSDSGPVELVGILQPGLVFLGQTQTVGSVAGLGSVGNPIKYLITNLPAGNPATFEVTARIAESIPDGTVLTFSTGLFASPNDTETGNNVAVSQVKAVNLPQNRLSVALTPNPLLRYRGQPGRAYTFQSGVLPLGPYTNLTLPLNSDAAGMVSFEDQPAAEAAKFYRVRGE